MVLLKETFFDIMQLSYTTDGSGINHREYNRVKESTVWANNSLDEWALFLVGRVKKLVSLLSCNIMKVVNRINQKEKKKG